MNRPAKLGLAAAAVIGVAAGSAVALSHRAAEPVEVVPIMVYKSPTCGCCNSWIEHLEKNGFKATVTDMYDVDPVKAQHGVPRNMTSCHTALVDTYVVEGHVPADLIRKMLRERPRIAGLTVPGMPMGSPGMEGRVKEPYAVYTFDQEGRTEVYATR